MRLVIAALLSLAGGAQAADIRWVEPIVGEFFAPYPMITVGEPMPTGKTITLGGPHLRVTGRIEAGDNAKLEALLSAELPNFNSDMFNEVVVSFDSDGGDFYEGLDMSDTIRGKAVATYVGPEDRCLSACAVAWLGGANVVLRGLPQWPTRYLHAQGVLGFHAPFTELGEALQPAPGAEVNAAAIADEFYAMARFAISELAARMDDWQVAPAFVFDMLSMGPPAGDTPPTVSLDALAEQFVLVETYARLEQTAGTLLTPSPSYPQQIGAADAGNACDFVHVYNRNRGNQRGYRAVLGPVASLAGAETSGQPYPLIATRPGPVKGIVYRHLVPASGPDSFVAEGIESGLGPVQCNVFRVAGQAWFVKTFNEEIHHVDPATGERSQGSVYQGILDAAGAHPINDFIRLGNHGSWLRPGHAIGTGYGPLPSDVAAGGGPSFDCNGDLDPAADVICRYPALSGYDGAMGTLYARARKRGLDVQAAQREWLKDRDLACRPARIDLNNPLAAANLGHCLAHFTRMRVDRLAALLRD